MAQTAPPPSGENIPRPLPRGGRPQRTRDTRPRFAPLDATWMAALAVLFVALGLLRNDSVISLTVETGVLFLTYLIGWRSSGRPAGVISGLLLATSAPFLSPHSLTADLFALLSIGAIFSFVAGSSLIALVLAAAAIWVRADGLVLGLMLLTITLVQHRRRAWLGTLLFSALTLAALFVPMADGGHPFSLVTFGLHSAFWVGLAAPAMLFTFWFILPFFGEIADPVRRARWLPTVGWTCLYAITATVMAFSHADSASIALVPFLPLLFLLAGAGLARLLPVMTGDLPIPALRYVVATLAVVSLAAIRMGSERKPTPVPAPMPSAPVIVTPAPQPLSAAVPLPLTGKRLVAVKPKPKAVKPKHPPTGTVVPPKAVPARPKTLSVKPKPVAKPAAPKPIVRQYIMKNGRLVKRSKWAIQWDMTHPQP